MKEKTEAFVEYAQIDRGIPFLWMGRRRNSGSASWGDGTLWDYSEFRHAIDHEAMFRDLGDLWEKAPKTRRKAEMHRGGVHGGMYFVPPDIAEAAFVIVRDYFAKGLASIAKTREARP